MKVYQGSEDAFDWKLTETQLQNLFILMTGAAGMFLLQLPMFLAIVPHLYCICFRVPSCHAGGLMDVWSFAFTFMWLGDSNLQISAEIPPAGRVIDYCTVMFIKDAKT